MLSYYGGIKYEIKFLQDWDDYKFWYRWNNNYKKRISNKKNGEVKDHISVKFISFLYT